MKRFFFFLLLAVASTVFLTNCGKDKPTPTPSADPVANFSYTKNQDYAPAKVTFTNTSSDADTYEWDFGISGQTSTVKSPEFTYTQPGSYTVKLVAKKGSKSNTKIQTVEIAVDPSQPDAPVAEFGINNEKSSYAIGETITFINTSRNDNAWAWDFGDNQTSTDENPTHAYAAAGTYIVKLVAKKGTLTSVAAKKNITVDLPPATPFAGYNTYTSGGANDLYGTNNATAPKGLGTGTDYKYPTDQTKNSFQFGGTTEYLKLTDGLISTKVGTPITISFWFKVPTIPPTGIQPGVLFGYQNAAAGSASDPNYYVPAIYYAYDGKIHAAFWHDQLAAKGGMMVSGNITTNTWHHLALVGGPNSQTLYIDGEVQGTPRPVGINYAGMNVNQFGVGFSKDVTNYPSLGTGWVYFKGSIDEIKIFNKAISAQQVATLAADK